LGLGPDESGIWELPARVGAGDLVSEALDLEDVILEIGVTPNRGDCLSVIGIAREVAALCKGHVRHPETHVRETGPRIETLTSITVHDADGCPRYAGRVLQGITVGPSPDWLRDRLHAVGLRSINNIVDVTNFVLMELGQPLHAFDYDRLREHRIVVRSARDGERFTTLDGVERTLFGDTLLICDGVGPVAIAGIMGGLDSEIVPETRRVLIESAYFNPLSIRRSSKKLGLKTESAYRFERGVDPQGVLRALDRAAQLMCELAGGTAAAGCIDVVAKPISVPALPLRVARTNRFLGTDLTASEMAEALASIEMRIESHTEQELLVRPPSFRSDVTREVDLAEEVVRVVGYDRVPVTTPKGQVVSAELDPHLECRLELKNALQAVGFFEVITYSFIGLESLRRLGYPEDDARLRPVRIKNPLSEELAVMRTSLVPGLLQAARHNFDRGNEDLRLFELSKAFIPQEGQTLPEEPHHLVGVMAGRRDPDFLYGSEEEIDYGDVKGVVEEIMQVLQIHPVQFRTEGLPPYLDSRRSAAVFCNGEVLGWFGKLSDPAAQEYDLKKTVHVFELDFDRIYARRCPRPLFRALPKFPSVVRDIALVVDERVPVQEPLDFIQGQQIAFLEKTEVFDVYTSPQLGSGKRSLGYRLVYRAPDRSLTDEEVNVLHRKLVDKVIKEFDASLR
ncbi:MAG: phenylalanine--tRNA ligase subunit beta, partial [Syntrophobacteraceae bacterium]|nr:phenylalanine--tRNA ligase subunit beta [Syntrophobacteraceae bacterium]